MSVDDRGARPLDPRENRALDDIERGLAADPGLRAALRHGVWPDTVPRRGRLALALGAGCVLVTTSALVLGPEVAMGVALTGVTALLAVAARVARRR